MAAKGWEGYADEPGFCRSAQLEEVTKHGFVLTPGRYVGAEDVEDDGIEFAERFGELRARLTEQFTAGRALEVKIEATLGLIRG